MNNKEIHTNLNFNNATIVVATLAALIPTYLVRFQIFGIPTTLWEVLLWASALAIFGVWGARKVGRLISSDPLKIPLLMIFIAGSLALLFNPDFLSALGQWKAILIDGLLFYILVRGVQTEIGHTRPIIFGAMVGGTIMGIQALFDRIVNPETDRIIGIFIADPGASPNYLALYLAPLVTAALVWGVALILNKQRSGALLFSLIAMGILMAGAIVATGSRGGMLAVGAGLYFGIVFLLNKFFSAKRTKITVFSVILALVLIVGLVPRFLPDLSAEGVNGGRLVTSNNVRYEIWRTTITTVIPATSFFGLGWGNYQAVFTDLTAGLVNYPEYIAPLALHPHNFWLMSWVTLGFLGVVGWLAAFIHVLRLREKFNLFQLALFAAAIAWFTHGLVDTSFYKNDLSPLFFLILASLNRKN